LDRSGPAHCSLPPMSAPRSEGRLSTEPTERHVANAREFLETHVRVCVPESVCNWCLRAWPCPAASWSAQVLDRAGEGCR
jgi:hypothetical protein